jgi:UDP-2,4-diacetamido-2,4,6-trideoxy-beta-L-altropyranose hydrolase
MQSLCSTLPQEMTSTVAFRVDASNQIGTGHVTRCIALADELTAAGMRCCFICRSLEGNMILNIRNHGYKTFELPKNNRMTYVHDYLNNQLEHADWLGVDWLTDAEQTAAILELQNITWLVIDHYAIDIKWEEHIKPYINYLCVIDDLDNRNHSCEILIDQNWFGLQTNLRYDKKVNHNCIKLVGPNYAIIKSIYLKARKKVKKRSGIINTILVFFGGSDQQNQTEKTLAALSNDIFDEIYVDIVVGPNYLNYEALSQLASKRSRTKIYKNLPDLSDLMVKADIMIGAGGTTTWERMCLGLPSLIISIANNQTQICIELNNAGFINYIGEFNNVGISDIEKKIIQITLQPDLLKKQSEIIFHLVDGYGTSRVVQAFQQIASLKK